MDEVPWVVASVAIIALVLLQHRFERDLTAEREGIRRTHELSMALARELGKDIAEAQMSVGHATYLVAGMAPPEASYRGYPVCCLDDAYTASMELSPPLSVVDEFVSAYNGALLKRVGDAPSEQPEPGEDTQPDAPW